MGQPSLSDLDRCEHGRHSIDNCLMCPGGESTGNLFLTNGQRIGTDYAGNPIHVETRREGGRGVMTGNIVINVQGEDPATRRAREEGYAAGLAAGHRRAGGSGA